MVKQNKFHKVEPGHSVIGKATKPLLECMENA